MIPSIYLSDWQNARIQFILEKYNKDFFKNKKILELGSHNGYIGEYFRLLGSDVLSVEGREENVNYIKNTYPNLNIICENLDTDIWKFETFDIIINFGLYYHLEKHHTSHLKNCLNNCKLMFFESVIYDSIDEEVFLKPEYGRDQSMSDVGGTPSTSFTENIFKTKNCKFKKYCDKKLNAEGHHYDWEDKNSKVFDGYSRRFWIVECI
jgi:hypothetical protein